MIKMVVTDLDDTLLKTDKTISDFTVYILQEIRKQGIKMIFATARGVSAGLLLAKELFDGRVLMNGAKAFVGNELVYTELIPAELFLPFLRELTKRGLPASAEIDSIQYANFNVQEKWPYITDFVLTDYSQAAGDAEKLFVLAEDTKQVEIISSLLPKGLYMNYSRDGMAMIMGERATKLNGIMRIANEFSIAVEEIVAFGDDVNDMEMLKGVGLGVAMANALDEVKAVADCQCADNNSDGVANWLNDNIIKPSKI